MQLVKALFKEYCSLFFLKKKYAKKIACRECNKKILPYILNEPIALAQRDKFKSYIFLLRKMLLTEDNPQQVILKNLKTLFPERYCSACIEKEIKEALKNKTDDEITYLIVTLL